MVIEYPIPLKVSPQKAKMWIDQIPHENCRRGGNTCWSVNSDGAVSEKSVNWLYCWAMTGQGSARARDEARLVFDKVLSVSFVTYNSAVSHEYARKHRY